MKSYCQSVVVLKQKKHITKDPVLFFNVWDNRLKKIMWRQQSLSDDVTFAVSCINSIENNTTLSCELTVWSRTKCAARLQGGERGRSWFFICHVHLQTRLRTLNCPSPFLSTRRMHHIAKGIRKYVSNIFEYTWCKPFILSNFTILNQRFYQRQHWYLPTFLWWRFNQAELYIIQHTEIRFQYVGVEL
jgi:hypothetical protein